MRLFLTRLLEGGRRLTANPRDKKSMLQSIHSTSKLTSII